MGSRAPPPLIVTVTAVCIRQVAAVLSVDNTERKHDYETTELRKPSGCQLTWGRGLLRKQMQKTEGIWLSEGHNVRNLGW